MIGLIKFNDYHEKYRYVLFVYKFLVTPDKLFRYQIYQVEIIRTRYGTLRNQLLIRKNERCPASTRAGTITR